MTITLENKKDYFVVKINSAKVNYENANELSKLTVNAIEKDLTKKLAIDFSKVDFISSIGISALSVIKGIAKIHDCKTVLYGINQDVTETLDQTGINALFKLLPSEKAAIEYFESRLKES